MPRLIYKPRALDDLSEIHDYIAQDNPAAAARQILSISKSCEALAGMPGIGRGRPDLRPGMRTWPVGFYLVLHREVQGGIEVVRVVHGARDLDDIDLDD